MVVLVILQGVVLLVLAVLVVGLLRSHAEILRRLHELGAGVYEDDEDDRAAASSAGVTSPVELTDGPRAVSTAPSEATSTPGRPDIRTTPGVPTPRDVETPAHDVAGMTPEGGAKAIGVVGSPTTTLLAFLSSGCGTCMDFWRAFAEGEATDVLGPTRLVVVTKGPDEESQAAVQSLAPRGITTVMSSEAYTDYRVPVSPYFILVDGAEGRIIGEGAAATWAQVSHLLQQAAADAGVADRAPGAPRVADIHLTGAEREARADAELLAAGITPGHGSLYPDRIADEPDSGAPGAG